MTNISQIITEREKLAYSYLPLGIFQNSGKWPDPCYGFSLFLYTNDSSDRISEWISYHQHIGFTHFYIYSFHKDPQQFYKKLLPFISANPSLITYHHYPQPGTERLAFCHYFHNYGHESQWIMPLGIDEFLCLKNPKNISTFIHSMDTEIKVLYFNHCIYGHNDLETDMETDILLNYTLRSETLSIKTSVLIKNQYVPYHLLFQSETDNLQNDCLCPNLELQNSNVLHNSMNLYFSNYPESAMAYLRNHKRYEQILEIAYIAHFGIPSIEFIQKQIGRDSFQFYSGKVLDIETTKEKLIEYGQSTNEIEDLFLQNIWVNILVKVWQSSIFPVNFWTLLSQDKPAEQSSTDHEGSASADADRLVNGRLTGHAQNLTKTETDPWWCLDLQQTYLIHEIQVYNRLDRISKENSHFELYVSIDKLEWKRIIKKRNGLLFGGMDGSPFIWTSEEGEHGQYVKLIIPGQNQQIALDQIQVFGQEILEQLL